MARTKSVQRSKTDAYIAERLAAGASSFVFCGGRRSGKTYSILTFLLLSGALERLVVSVATMTQEQGRLGAHADAKEIIVSHPATFGGYTVLESPREIRHANGTRIFFNSYIDSERAKGIACDYLFLNEANKFSKQQYIDLSVNVRRATFLDYNPTKRFWVGDFFEDADICHTTPFDNPYLTKSQREQFETLKRLALRPDASEVDIYNYKVQVLGEYYDMQGSIFNQSNIHFGELPEGLRGYMVFCDPSALRGNDYFACVLSATDGERIYIVDTISTNTGTAYDMAAALRAWCSEYDVEALFVETNGVIGIDFYEFLRNSDIPASGWYSKGRKFDRVVAKYGTITQKVVFAPTVANSAFVAQVYDFAEVCEHDDNIDALASTISARAFVGL